MSFTLTWLSPNLGLGHGPCNSLVDIDYALSQASLSLITSTHAIAFYPCRDWLPLDRSLVLLLLDIYKVISLSCNRNNQYAHNRCILERKKRKKRKKKLLGSTKQFSACILNNVVTLFSVGVGNSVAHTK